MLYWSAADKHKRCSLPMCPSSCSLGPLHQQHTYLICRHVNHLRLCQDHNPAAFCKHQQLCYSLPHHNAAHAIAELGIDIGAILRSTKAILLHQMRSPALDGLDLGGALVFLLALGGLHLLVGGNERTCPSRQHVEQMEQGQLELMSCSCSWHATAMVWCPAATACFDLHMAIPHLPSSLHHRWARFILA